MQIPGISEREWGRRRHGFSSTPFPFAFPFVSSLFSRSPRRGLPCRLEGTPPPGPSGRPGRCGLAQLADVHGLRHGGTALG